jgi:hypothetical protein
MHKDEPPEDLDGLYEALAAMIPALRLLEAALEGGAKQRATKQPLAVVKGQGRGSRKPKANLQTVGDDHAS